MIHLDTHAAVWLYAGHLSRFPPHCLELMEAEELAISPMATLEMQYLHEIGRITVQAPTIVENLRATVGLTVSTTPFHRVVAESLLLSWTRDPFDRLIVAQSQAEGVRLVTKDQIIRQHCPNAFWE